MYHKFSLKLFLSNIETESMFVLTVKEVIPVWKKSVQLDDMSPTTVLGVW